MFPEFHLTTAAHCFSLLTERTHSSRTLTTVSLGPSPANLFSRRVRITGGLMARGRGVIAPTLPFPKFQPVEKFASCGRMFFSKNTEFWAKNFTFFRNFGRNLNFEHSESSLWKICSCLPKNCNFPP